MKEYKIKIILFVSILFILCSLVFNVLILRSLNISSAESIRSSELKLNISQHVSKLAFAIEEKSIYVKKDKDLINASLAFIRDNISKTSIIYPFYNKLFDSWETEKNKIKPNRKMLLDNLIIFNDEFNKLSHYEYKQSQQTISKYFIFLITVGIFAGFLSFFLIVFSLFLEFNEAKRKELFLKKLKESEFKAVESSKEKTLFLAIVGHELRTPLNGIIGLAELLRRGNLPEVEKVYIDNIYHSGRSLLKVINNILEFSKVEYGKIDLENLEFSLITVINQIITSLSVQAKNKNIRLNIKLDESLPRKIVGDSSRLTQVIYNLVGNAIKFTAVGSVTLRVSVKEVTCDHKLILQFVVEDTGIGMSESKLKKIFLPFNVLDSKGTDGELGSGLGLAISQQLIKAMNGEIYVTSKPGVGSIFSFTCTFSSFSSDSVGKVQIQDQLYNEEHLEIKPLFSNDFTPVILVVDDNPTNLLMAQAMLEKLGAKTLAASNGKEAIYEYSNSKIDLILMDCQMPVMDGFEATRELRKRDATIPILAMTANTGHEEKEKCLSAGMNGFIVKPISLALLSNELLIALSPKYETLSYKCLNKIEEDIGKDGKIKVIESYLEELPKVEKTIYTFLSEKNIEGLHEVGHLYKASSQLVGASKLANLFLELESVQQIDEAEEIYEEIKKTSTYVSKNLSDHVANLY